MCCDVLEHLHDSPRPILGALVDTVRSGGFLVVTVPNAVNLRKRIAVATGKSNLPDFQVFYWYPGDWRGHVREYTHGDLRMLAENLGLAVVELNSVHRTRRCNC